MHADDMGHTCSHRVRRESVVQRSSFRAGACTVRSTADSRNQNGSGHITGRRYARSAELPPKASICAIRECLEEFLGLFSEKASFTKPVTIVSNAANLLAVEV